MRDTHHLHLLHLCCLHNLPLHRSCPCQAFSVYSHLPIRGIPWVDGDERNLENEAFSESTSHYSLLARCSLCAHACQQMRIYMHAHVHKIRHVILVESQPALRLKFSFKLEVKPARTNLTLSAGPGVLRRLLSVIIFFVKELSVSD